MSERERDVLKVMALVLTGKRTQCEAARLLNRSERQIRRIQRRLEEEGDGGVVHRLRARASNNAMDGGQAKRALSLYREHYAGFGPTMAAEKLAQEHDVVVSAETLRGHLLACGLWQRQRQRDKHRRRRPRRSCFGEMVLADASEHDWLEGRGPMLTLVGIIDDATDRTICQFFESETTEAYMTVLRRWIEEHGRPANWYSDRHSIFRAEEKVAGYDQKQSVLTQFSRGLKELGIELILAGSPQAKGRVERLWGTAQDRLVKELRLAKATTIEQANAVVQEKFLPWFNGCCTHQPASGNDAHKPLGKQQNLDAILSIQEQRVVGNDYTIRFENQVYQLLPPVHPGQRKGKVTVEQRSDGTMHIRFKGRYLPYCKFSEKELMKETDGGVLSLSQEPIPAEEQPKGSRVDESTRPAVHRAASRSGRTPALPCLSGGGRCGSGSNSWRPASNHPWR